MGYESWLERDRLVLLTFDPDDVGISSQPFRPRPAPFEFLDNAAEPVD